MNRIVLLLLFAVATGRAAEPFRLLETTAAKDTNAVLCTITWNATPPEFEVTQYAVYQAGAVTGPYYLISTTDTNELTLVVELGTHFWNVRALSVWNGSTNTSAASKSVGMVESAPKGVGVKKVPPGHQARNITIPDALMVPMGRSPVNPGGLPTPK